MTNGFREKLADGRRAMAHLIHVWHERNGWSHKVLPALAESLDLGKVHNSQISNLRNGKLASPGPEVFLALAQINTVLNEGLDPISEHLADVHPELLKVLSESAIPLQADNGQPISAGGFFEIFLGLAPLPASFDWFIEEAEAEELSAAIADCLCDGKPWRQCKNEVLNAYPVSKSYRRERFASVMAGLRDYSAEELDGELLDLHTTYKKIFNAHDDFDVANFLGHLRLRVSSVHSKNQSNLLKFPA